MAYIGEIRMFAGNFPPNGWAFLDGAPIPIAENDALFILIGTTYGGDGQSTFHLPNMQGRVPLHPNGSTYLLGGMGGVEEVTLTTSQMPAHTHALLATTSNAQDANAANNILAQPTTFDAWQSSAAPNQNMAPQAIAPLGGSQPHYNMQPYLGINYIISLYGIFPTET